MECSCRYNGFQPSTNLLRHSWSIQMVFLCQVTDISLVDYIAVKAKFATFVPHTAGRYQKKRFRKAQCPIVERYSLCTLCLCGL